jgi:hypothetical protein
MYTVKGTGTIEKKSGRFSLPSPHPSPHKIKSSAVIFCQYQGRHSSEPDIQRHLVSRSGNSRPLHQSSATYLTVPERSSSNHSYQNGYASSPPDNSFNSSSGYEEVFTQPQQQLPQHEQQLPLQQQQQHEQQLPLQLPQHEQQLPLQQQHEQQLPLQQQHEQQLPLQQQHSDYPTHYSPSVIQTVPYLSPSQPVKEASPSGSASAFPSGGRVEEPQLYTRPCQGSRGTTSSAGVGTTGGAGISTVNESSERDPVARNAGRGRNASGGGGGANLKL